MWLFVLTGCGLLPPLTFDSVVVRTLTFDRLDADLAYLVDDGDAEAVDDLAVDLRVDGETLVDEAYGADEASELGFDGSLVLAPVAVDLAALAPTTWERLVGRDDEVPFEVETHYHYQRVYGTMDYVVIESGALPAPRAPEVTPRTLTLDVDAASLVVEIVNPNATAITWDADALEIQVDGGPRTTARTSVAVDGGSTETLEIALDAWTTDEDVVNVTLGAASTVETVFGPIPTTIDAAAAVPIARPRGRRAPGSP